MMPEEERKNFNFYKEICKSFKPGAAQVTGEVVTGDTAVLTVKMDNKKDKIPMKKEDGNWKVDFASAFKGGPGGGDEPPPPPAPSPAPSPTPAPAPAPAPAP